MSYLEQNSPLPSCWKNILHEYLISNRFKDLDNFVLQAYQNKTCFPPIHEVFRAFQLCSWDNIKVVIIGQDPYHGPGQANGLCFSVNDGVAIPPSLKNIFTEINTEYDRILFPTSGNLERWAKQGVLLLNAGLTVRKDQANSHKHLKWNVFTDAVIDLINQKSKNVVFLLWGSFAQKKGVKIDREKHLVLECGHPSPLSANQGKWFGNKHFSKTNAYLESRGLQPINWLNL